MENKSDQLLRLDDVTAQTKMSRAWIYAAITRGEFPRPVKLGARAARWIKGEVDAFLEQHKAERLKAEQHVGEAAP
jgi:prophage regulatory protein